MPQQPVKNDKQITIDVHPTEKQYLGWLAVNNDAVDDVIVGGAAGGGKTWFGCEFILSNAIRWAGSKQFIGRNELKRLMQSSYVTLTTKVLPAHKLKQGRDWWFNGQYNVLRFANGSTVDMLDLAHSPGDPMFERFGSLEYTRGWIEEASEVNFKAYDVLKSRVGRHLNKEMSIKSRVTPHAQPVPGLAVPHVLRALEGSWPSSRPEQATGFPTSSHGRRPDSGAYFRIHSDVL